MRAQNSLPNPLGVTSCTTYKIQIYGVEARYTHNWLFARKKIKGGGAKDNKPLFFKMIGYCFHCSFDCFFKILGGQKSFWGASPVAQTQIISW